jgi:sulfane dehydrogenase subunit SoxC
VPLSLLLKSIGVKNRANWIVAEGLDAQMHTKSAPMAKVMDDVLVVYGQNGEAARPKQGYPLRYLEFVSGHWPTRQPRFRRS